MSLALVESPSITVPARPRPTAIQAGVHSDTSYTGESGSSHGQQTSGSFVLLPPGAKIPSPPPTEIPISLSSPPARRLSRAPHKPLPALPREPFNSQKRPKTLPQAPSSWAIHFRGFVKAVKWSKSSSQLVATSASLTPDAEKDGKQLSTPTAPLKPAETSVDMAATENSRVEPLTKGSLLTNGNNLPSFSKQKKSLPTVSANAGGVFLVPHVQSAPPVAVGVHQELRPPSAGWMRPVPINPYDYSSVRTIIGTSSIPSRTSMDNMYLSSPSPPLAELPVRKSVSEVGHGSVTYAALSPDPSMSSIEQFPTFPTFPGWSANASQENIGSNRASIDQESGIEMAEPKENKRQSRIRLDSFKRALSFKRLPDVKSISTSDIPSSTSDASPPDPAHRQSNSIDSDRPLSNFAVDENGRRRLRRRSTVGVASRGMSPSSFHLREPPMFTIGPDHSNSSLVSNGRMSATPTPSSDLGSVTTTGSRSHTRRRLTKRRPSEKSRSSLPTTLEVDTPKSLDKPNPMESLVIPSQPRFSHYANHVPELSTSTSAPVVPVSDSPHINIDTPLSAPALPTSALIVVESSNTLPLQPPPPPPKQIGTLNGLQTLEDVPPVPPIPPYLQSQPHSVIITRVHDGTTSTTTIPGTSSVPPVPPIPPTLSIPSAMSSIKGAVPPSAMLNIRPALPHRPSLERRASRRRWTLDVAAQDIDDNILKQELERLRLLGEPSAGIGGDTHDSSWTLARKALLSSREVILTERSYLNQLTRFLAEFASDVGAPALLRQHLPLLISASQAFCNRMSEDPSAWGVSAAFVSVEAILEQVLVDYCRVAGKIMVACRQGSGHKSSPSSGSGSKLPSLKRGNGNASENGKKLPALPPPPERSSEKIADGKDKDGQPNHSEEEKKEKKSSVPRSKSMPGKGSKWRMSLPLSANASSTSLASKDGKEGKDGSHSGTASSVPSPTTTERKGLAHGKARAITALDIAIAPPQRVTRYVMLYRNLLNGTPLTAPSRPLVQRALDGALRIAELCDKAQSDRLFVFPTGS